MQPVILTGHEAVGLAAAATVGAILSSGPGVQLNADDAVHKMLHDAMFITSGFTPSQLITLAQRVAYDAGQP